MKTRKIVVPTLCVLISGIAQSVRADGSENSTTKSLTLGVGAQYSPRYSGADQGSLQIRPVIQAQYDALFFDAFRGIGYHLQNDAGFYVEHSLGINPGRSDRNNGWRAGSDKLKGMGKIDPSVNTTLTLGWALTPWLQLEGAATLPLSDSQGGQYRTALTVIPFQNDSDTLVVQSAALFGDARYMNRFYGVNREQSARAGYSRFEAQGGFYGVESSLTWGHQFTPHWGTSLSVGYTWLGDRTADSPLVYRRNQTSGIMAVNYTF